MYLFFAGCPVLYMEHLTGISSTSVSDLNWNSSNFHSCLSDPQVYAPDREEFGGGLTIMELQEGIPVKQERTTDCESGPSTVQTVILVSK